MATGSKWMDVCWMEDESESTKRKSGQHAEIVAGPKCRTSGRAVLRGRDIVRRGDAPQ